MSKPSIPLLALDPGPKESAWVVLDGTRVEGAFELNEAVVQRLRRGLLPWGSEVPIARTTCAIEMLAGSYGQAVGIETMETAFWAGRFAEAWESTSGSAALLVFRKTAVACVTGNPRANDSHVRQALVDRFGGDSVALAKPRRCEACKGRGLMKVQRLRTPGKAGLPCPDCHATGRVGADGPLRGISGHLWAALAVAVTAQERSVTR